MSKPKILDIWLKICLEKLWKLNINSEEINISELKNNLDIPYLEKEWTDDWNLTPRMLIENFDNEVSHKTKVLKANLIYPIEIYNNKWKWIILDWVHRFVKLIQSWEKIIKVRKVSKDDLEKI